MVKFGNKLEGAFTECTVVTAEHDVVEHRFFDSKGKQGYYALPGSMKFGRLTLKRGMTDDMSAWKWRTEVINGEIDQARTNGSITMLDEKGSPLAEFNFENVWPSKVSGPSPNAAANEVAVEEIELVCEKITRAS
jgi:phage tail-like protein